MSNGSKGVQRNLNLHQGLILYTKEINRK